MTQPARTVSAVRVESGFTLVSAVFLIAILASLSAYLMNFRVYQDAGMWLDVSGTRAYAAARSGVEWAAYKSLRDGTCSASSTVALGGTFAGYTVNVTCSTSSYNEGGSTINVDTIVATACNSATCPQAAPGPNYAERQITVMVSR